MIIATKICLHCGKAGQLEVDPGVLMAYQRGALVQEVWPDKPASWREQIITGTHPECWDAMTKEWELEEDV